MDMHRADPWSEYRSWIHGLPGGGLNIAYEAIGRHVAEGRGESEALRWLPKGGGRRSYSYAELDAETAQFANLLNDLDVGRSARVFSLLGRVPQLYIAALGTLRAGAVFCPLYAAFGPEPVRARMEIGAAEVLVTTAASYRRKVLPWRGELASLKHVLIVGDASDLKDVLTFDDGCSRQAAAYATAETRADDLALLHFTSGTTGRPKGAMHVHDAVVAHHATGRVALDLREGDIFWCTADPGWVTGTSYGIIAPLTNGATLVVDEAEFDAERWYGVLEREQVTVWYTAPTAIRLLMKAGDELPKKHDLSRLRFLASVGEPLHAEAVLWSERVLGRAFRDNWWQTETGGIMIANLPGEELRLGSMGKPLPGVEAAIADTKGETLRIIDEPGLPGQLVLRAGWPSMFRGYLHEEARYAACFRDGWYLTGDLARRDGEGFYWFIGRADDVIKSAGHLIGPFEVESALLTHPAVAEAAAIGLPDERAGEVVKAFVSLKGSFAPSDALQRALLGHSRKLLGAVIAPRSIEIRDALPRTRSGKIMRRLLRARELGLPEGDLSALESGA
ncbi:acetate--CoA ligase [Sphingomonas sp. GCM10030256]|uniref:acetate--CoA ligase n=1 Tax=Sphingomonas sp. GCM10030256 TaxID=3273427 RepID=UPI0036232850